MKLSPSAPLSPVKCPRARSSARSSKFRVQGSTVSAGTAILNPQSSILALSIAALAATGCTVLTYKSDTGEHFTRTSFGSKTSIAHLTVESRTNGLHKVDLRGYKDDNTEALGTITDAAVRAAIAAAKP